jgi:pilus assembly protein CpaF
VGTLGAAYRRPVLGGHVDAIAVVEDEVRELVRRRGLDPAAEPGVVRRLVEEVVADYDERSLAGTLPPLGDPRGTVREVFDSVAGFGSLQRYLDDPSVEEVWINEPGRVFVARHGRSELTTTILTPTAVRDLVERMLKTSGRRVDLSSPILLRTCVPSSTPGSAPTVKAGNSAWNVSSRLARRSVTDTAGSS